MADSTTEKEVQNEETPEMTFICQRCHRTWNLKDMRRVLRFRPILLVCPDCDKELR